MVTDAQKRAMRRYGETTKQYVFRFRKIGDAAVIKKLEESSNKTGYVRELIAKDISDEQEGRED